MSHRRQSLIVAAICMIVLLVAGGYSLAHYLSYHAAAYDLGFFDNVTEHPWSTSFLTYSFLGQHWEPILLVPAGLDRLLPTPIWLLLLQATALAAAPAAAAWLAASWLPRRPRVVIMSAAVVGLSPILSRAASFDFHTEALTPFLALVALGAAARHRRWLCLLCVVLLLLVKEDAALVVVGIGVVVWRVERQRIGLLIAAAGLTTFAVIVGLVMPALRAGASSDLVARYAYLGGDTPSALVGGALLHPERVINHLLSSAALAGVLVALAPLALLPLLGGWGLVAALPVTLVTLLSADPQQQALLYHYGLEALPLLIAAALLGWRRLESWIKAHPARLPIGTGAALIAMAAAIAGYALLSPLPGGRAFDAGQLAGLERRNGVERLLRTVPGDVAVSASTGLVPHLSARAEIREFPAGIGLEWIVLDSVTRPSSQARDAGYDSAQARLAGLGYRATASEQGVTIWRRQAGGAK